MTPAARVQAAIEVLDLVIEAARSNGAPADRLIADWFRPRRFAGSSDRRAVRELAYAIATETHAPNNLQVLKYLKAEFGATQDRVDIWYRHWLARTFVPIEARLEQLGSGDFLFDTPGLFEVLLLPQLYNARRFALDLEPMPRIRRIEAACLALPAFQRAHPDNQPDNPERKDP